MGQWQLPSKPRSIWQDRKAKERSLRQAPFPYRNSSLGTGQNRATDYVNPAICWIMLTMAIRCCERIANPASAFAANC